jgi:hypothetical protein
MSGSVGVNMNFSGLMVLEKIFSYINTYKIWFPLLWPYPTPRGHDVDKLESELCQEVSQVNMNFSGLMVLEKKIFPT